MCRVVPIVLLLTLCWASHGSSAEAEPASVSPAKSASAPTPIPLAKVPAEAQSASNVLAEIEPSLSSDQSMTAAASESVSKLSSEIGARIVDDTKLLTAIPSLDLLYGLKATWRNFDESLSESARGVANRVSGLDEELLRLDQLNKTWQATLQSAKQPDTPPSVLQGVQSVVDSIGQTRQAAESCRVQDLNLQSRISEEEGRVRTVLSSIEQSQNRALKNVLVKDSPPIWSLEAGLGRILEKQSGESFSSQWSA